MARPQQIQDNLPLLKQAIKEKTPAPLYVFHGEEAYLRSYWLDRLYKLLIDPVTEAFNYHVFTSETFSAQALQDSLDAQPMMAERSLIRIDDVDLFKLPEDERNACAALLSEIPPMRTVVLVYETTEYKPDKRMKALSSALEGAVEVCFRTPGERELVVWLTRHFQSRGKTADSRTCQYLIQMTGGDMTRLLGEIEKLCAYTQGEEITRAEIDAVVEPVLEAVVFELSDAIASGRFDAALHKLETLLQMQEEPIPILGAISSQMRRTLTAKILLRAGRGVKELMALCGIASYPASKTLEFARRMPDRFCEQAVLLCLETDERMKTSFDEPARLLELLVLRLAQEARRA